MSFYNPKEILKRKAIYNVIFGERSNGKTYAFLKHSLEQWVKNRSQLAYVRRWKEEIIGRRASEIFSALNVNGEVTKITEGQYTGVYYYAGKFFLCTYDDKGKAIYNDNDVLGYLFALSESGKDKSISFPKVETIVFDEFLTNSTYLNDEFMAFMNTVSTIVRQRDNVKVFMLGNTVNKYCPYFDEMGLSNIKTMGQGSIDVYKYGESGLTTAVEYCASASIKKASNKYFAFNNPKLDMITGGAWELAIYPHLPYKYKPKEILLTYFIEFSGLIYQAEVIQIKNIHFTFIHNKTTPIKNPENYIIYSLDYNPELNYNRNILKPMNRIQEKILWYFNYDRVYYQDNNVGDAIANYLKLCKRG